MAKVPLSLIDFDSIQHKLLDNNKLDSNKLAEAEHRVEQAKMEVRKGWGDKYIERVHAKGKLTARERIELLKDPASDIYEIGTLVNYTREFDKLKSPAAGVVTCFIRICDRWCIVVANDNTVASGAWWPNTPEKIQRAQQAALKLCLPIIYLVDCSGLYLPEQSNSFAGHYGAGHIFKMNSKLADAGVAQLAGVFGDCIAGGGYMPIISDRVYMTEQAYMVIAGAALIKGAKSQKLTSLDIGGPEVHVHRSGCADVRVPDDETLIECLRSQVALLPSSAVGFERAGVERLPPLKDIEEISNILPFDHRQTYSAEAVLARLVDQSLFWEILPHIGRELICGVARISGLYVGLIINRQGVIREPSLDTERPGGILYREGITKLSMFSGACNNDGIPIIWLQDISGFDIGQEAEAQGLLGYGSHLIYTNSTNQVPMFTVLLRKASGAGYYAMTGMPYEPVLQLSTACSRLAVMEGRTLALAAYRTKLDENFEIATSDPEEYKKIEEGMEAVEQRIEADMDPIQAASKMDTDEVIKLSELRSWLVMFAEASYQSMGYRRRKNTRIWSLHDIDLISKKASHS